MIWYVDAASRRDGNGSRTAPFRTISAAAKLAMPGDEVVVAPGVYREHVDPTHAGTAEHPIVYRSVAPLAAIITGAELLTGWQSYEGSVWTTKVSNSVFGAYNPYTTVICGDWSTTTATRHAGAVFLNDRMMYETADLAECLAGETIPYAWERDDSRWKWFCTQDSDDTIFYANFHGLDPNAEKVEITVRRNCFMPSKTGVGYITVSGFHLSKAATTWAPPTAYQDGLIGPHWSKGWVIEDCEIDGSKCVGVSLGKYCDPNNEMYAYHHHIREAGHMEREAVCRALSDGWTKEQIGNHTVRRCHIHHCEQAGIAGHLGGVFSLIEDCEIHHICTTGQLGGCETAGIKLHAAIDTTLRRNHIHHCIMGVWLDWQAQGSRVTANLLHDNHIPDGCTQAPGTMFSTDLFIEVSHGPTLVDNNLLLSRVSVVPPSQGMAFVHNLMLGSFSWINNGVDSIVNGVREPRYTPYHLPHRTELAGFMTILHGDNRVYNNLFVRVYPVEHPERTPADSDYEIPGTKAFDIFPSYEEWLSHFRIGQPATMDEIKPFQFSHLPVWVEGNAYLNGADVGKHEQHGFIRDDAEVQVTLAQKDGKYYLQTDALGCLQDFRSRIITTQVLGEAFMPRQRFENPDGSDLILDEDYFGNHRGTAALPGPFSDEEATSLPLWG